MLGRNRDVYQPYVKPLNFNHFFINRIMKYKWSHYKPKYNFDRLMPISFFQEEVIRSFELGDSEYNS